MLDNLSFPGLDLASGTLTLPVWAAGGAAVLLLVLLILALFRATDLIGTLVRVAFLVLAAAVAWALVTRFDERARADERRALDQRLAELNSRVLAPTSVLGCLEPGLGDAVDGSCEKILFAGPETVGAATALVAARWSLLADGLDYAHGKDPGYDANLDGLRRTLQADRFGFLAQVLSVREGCTASKCEALDRLSDPNRVRANLNERLFEGLVARSAAAWPSRTRPGTPTAAAPTNPAPASGIMFPSASSIPPVSIMNTEPPAAAPPPAAAAPAPAARRPPTTPPAARPAAPRPQAAQPAQQPVPIAPPATSSGSSSPPRQQ